MQALIASAIKTMNDQLRLDASIRPYHVFINHRGPDVKNTLASTIYYLLRDKGLNVFFDKTEFQPGQELLPTITEAIRTSSVQIAILSSNYAESPWCLDELCLMLKSGGKIIPVFYHVPPADLLRLQNGKGIYANSFKKLKKKLDQNRKVRYDSKRLLEWREALKQVSNVSGLELDSKIFNGDEGQLANTILSRVMEHFRKAQKKPVNALNDAVEDFMYFLSESTKECENAVTVGIVGTAGSGKTTLAEELYNRRLGYFDRSSFLFGVRNASKRNGLQMLQSQLVRDVTGDEVKIDNINNGKRILEDRLDCLTHQTSLKFLIVIDDVDNRDQLDALLPKSGLLGLGSWVIITSRDKAILKLSGISLHYKIKPLAMDDARELLCKEAFNKPEPIPGFEGLVERALRKCGGVPLLLKLIGGHLHLYGNNNKECCERELKMISDIPDILRIGFAAVGEEEKQIFLDIACFFHKMEKNSAIRIMDGLGWKGARAIQKLEYMCLLEIDDNNRLKLNDCLSNLGQEIADQQLSRVPDLPCRLWRPNEAANFLEGLLPVPLPEYTKIRGISEGTGNNHRHFQRRRLRTYAFSSVKLELLDVNGDLDDGIFGNRLNDLVWFRWKNCPRRSIALPGMNNLRVLELVKGKFTTLWDRSFELPTQLWEVRVKNCSELEVIPPRIESLKQLEKVTLNGCFKLRNLPQQFCQLQALKHLEIRTCEALTCLPDRFGELTNLQHIDFSDCQNLSKLPQSFGQLSQLKYLELRNCRNLMIQPELFGEITSLEQLSFENCKNLTKLPSQTTSQMFLRKLNLLGTSLEELPDNIDQLRRLKLLYIESPFLTRVPASLVNLRSMSEFVLFNCTQLINYPQFDHLVLSHDPYLRELKTLYVYGRRITDSNVQRYVRSIRSQ